MLLFQFPDGTSIRTEEGTMIAQMAYHQSEKDRIVGGIINGKVHDLNYRCYQSGSFEWIYQDSLIGEMMTERTLIFLFITAVHQVYPGVEVSIEHSFASGLYGTLNRFDPFNEFDCEQIRNRMQKMIDDKEIIYRRVVPTEEAVALFERLGMKDKARLLTQRTSTHSSIYTCAGVDDYFYGIMLPDASWIHQFTLIPYQGGFWLSTEKQFLDQPKLFEVYRQFEKRGRYTGTATISQLNQQIEEGKLSEIIDVNEQRVRKDLNTLADRITAHPKLKMILIAGPSSAGKTTFSRRLAKLLEERGRKPVAISMDDFFLDRVDSPRLPDGSYDYENIDCLDLKLFNRSMCELIAGRPVCLPTYNFVSGEKEFNKPAVTMDEDQILILEGLHALNPRSSQAIPEENKFRIYINALTNLNLDSHNRITTTDYRLIRRMTRDYQFRGRSVQDTLEGWDRVKDGEDRYIYPYQEQADFLFNTSMDYELPVLKTILLPLLNELDETNEEFIEANRIRKLLAYFADGDPKLVPHDSILSEFIGGSSFEE